MFPLTTTVVKSKNLKRWSHHNHGQKHREMITQILLLGSLCAAQFPTPFIFIFITFAYMHMVSGGCPRKSEGGVGLPVAGGVGAWELPNVGVETVFSDLSSLLSDHHPPITRVFTLTLAPK